MVEKNVVYDVKIETLGHNGAGITKIKGFAVFVEGAIPGDKIKIKILLIKKNYAIGRIIKILNPSYHRVEPVCAVFEKCGGCQLMHMEYQEQLRQKREKVAETLKRIGKTETIVHETLGMEEPYKYRNKAQFPVGLTKGKATMGFYRKRTHDLVDISCCHVQHPVIQRVMTSVKEYINKFNVSTYNEKTHRGLLRHVVTRVGFLTGEVMIIIVTNGNKLPFKNQLIEILKENITGLKSIIYNINTKNTNVILGQKIITIYGADKITDYIVDLKYSISPHSFWQVNPAQTTILYEKILAYADLKGEETVFDLYCGIGTISLFLAQKAKKVYGVEVVPQAVEDAKENAILNNIKNVEFYQGEAEKIVPELYKHGVKADLVIIDPPRKGCEAKLLQTITNMQPAKIIYVSCNPATLARDIAILERRGFTSKEVQPVDMFPQTTHVETICLLASKIKGFE